MRVKTPTLILLILSCFNALELLAQEDSTRLDIGYLRLDKKFTQTITIKGADLEKMPFANLSEAISAWAYGAYTPAMVQYIVDGSPVSDVNAYSIDEIDEIVLVHDAAALLSTGGGQQEIALIRTKRGKGPRGLTASAQTGLVNANSNGASTDTRFYNNYYVGAWRNLDKISMGLSANYLRDVFPVSDPDGKITTPYNLQRWRLNAYFTWRPDSHNRVEIALSYTPQQMIADVDSTQKLSTVYYQYAGKAVQRLALPHADWQSSFWSGWNNDLQATYLSSTYTENDLQRYSGSHPSYFPYPVNGFSEAIDADKSDHFWARDRLAYSRTAGLWLINPALNISYEHIDERFANASEQVDGGGYGNPVEPSAYPLPRNFTGLTYDEVFLTPAADISYGKSLHLLGGALLDAGHRQLYKGQRGFPFASVSLDLLHLADPHRLSSLQVFGSYAQTTQTSINGYALTDLSRGLDLAVSFPSPLVYSYLVNSPAFPLSRAYGSLPVPTFWVWETGAVYSGWGNRLQVTYTFERRNSATAGLALLPGVSGPPFIGNTYFTDPQWRSTLQHLDIRVKVLQQQAVSWQTGLNLTLLRSKVDSGGSIQIDKNSIGDTYPNPLSPTGGWVNRLQVKDFTAGLDMLYHFGETTVDASGNTHRLNSVVIPNVYLGYRCRSSHLPALEFFLESRGLVRTSTSDLMDTRRYYTVGGKVSL